MEKPKSLAKQQQQLQRYETAHHNHSKSSKEMTQVSHELKHSNNGNPTSLAASLADMSNTMSNFRLNKRPEMTPATQKTRTCSKKKKQAIKGENCNPSLTVDRKSKKNKNI